MRKTVNFVFRWLLLYTFFITAATTLLTRLAGLDRYLGTMLAAAAPFIEELMYRGFAAGGNSENGFPARGSVRKRKNCGRLSPHPG